MQSTRHIGDAEQMLASPLPGGSGVESRVDVLREELWGEPRQVMEDGGREAGIPFCQRTRWPTWAWKEERTVGLKIK